MAFHSACRKEGARSPWTVAMTVAAVLALIFAVFCGCVSLREGRPPDRVHRLVVLHTNDTHGHPVAFDHYPLKRVGGLPARATLVRGIRGAEANVLLLDAGDINTGCLVSNLFHAEPDILGFNMLGYDAMALGNHEFDQPMEVLKKQMNRAGFPFLSANVFYPDGSLLARSHVFRSFDGFRVAVFGLTAPETRFISNPDHVKGIVFEDPVMTARRLVPELRRQADVVIALTHLGVYPEADRGSRRLASEVPGIDLIVDGHSHTRLDQPIRVSHPDSDRDTLIVQAWEWGMVLGRLDAEIREGRIHAYSYRLMPIQAAPAGAEAVEAADESVPEDPALVELLRPYVMKAAAEGSRVVGRAAAQFPNDRVREEETALGNLVADSMLWCARDLTPDFALQNGGGVRASLPAGPLTIARIHEVLPFDNTVVVVDLSGRDVRAVFDRSASMGEGDGGFLQVSKGVRVAFRPGSGQCETIRVNGMPLSNDRVYRVATHSFLASGGDGYTMFANALRRVDTSRFQRDALVDFIAFMGGTVRPGKGGRIQLLRSMKTAAFSRTEDPVPAWIRAAGREDPRSFSARTMVAAWTRSGRTGAGVSGRPEGEALPPETGMRAECRSRRTASPARG